MATVYNSPDSLIPFEEKLKKSYGLKIAQFISGEWFGGGFIGNNTIYYKRRDYVRKKRLFVRGESDNAYFKEHFEKSDNGLDYLNLDWKQVNWAEKFARIVSNSISSQNYTMKVTSVDALSEVKRQSRERFYKKHILGRDLVSQFQQQLGVDVSPGFDIPETEEDIPLFMQMRDRPKIEIAEELMIKFTKDSNDFLVNESQWRKDLVDVGIICARVYIDKNDGLKIGYVDPETYIHSAVKRNDFGDKYYEGYVESITLSDIQRESDLDDDELIKIAKSYAHINGTIEWANRTRLDDVLGYKVDVCRFAYKTSKTIKYKTKKRKGKIVKANQRDDDFDTEENSDFGMLSKTLDTWLEGTLVIGTDVIYNYRECENIYDDIMNKSSSPFVVFAYDMYENRLRSFTDNIEVPARQLQKTHLKIQHLISELKPDIVEIDLDMLAELDDGKGGNKKAIWETALTLMEVKGVVFKKRVNMGEDGTKDESAVKTYAQSQGGALSALFNAWAHYYNLIRENTGINPAADGTMASYSLIGTNQMAQMASNTITKNIVDTYLHFDKKICEVVSSRLLTIFKYKDGKRLRDLYSQVVSKDLVESASILKDRHLHEFGFVIELRPTSEELQEFGASLNLALQEGYIDVEVSEQAKDIAKYNTKMALQYLMYQRKKKMREKQEEQMMLSQNKSENDAMAARAKVEAEMQAYEHKKRVDLEFEQGKAQVDIIKQKAFAEIKDMTREKEFNEKAYLKQLESVAMADKEKYREDRKDKRTEKQASQQSQLIEQRKGNASAIDFEQDDTFQPPADGSLPLSE